MQPKIPMVERDTYRTHLWGYTFFFFFFLFHELYRLDAYWFVPVCQCIRVIPPKVGCWMRQLYVIVDPDTVLRFCPNINSDADLFLGIFNEAELSAQYYRFMYLQI